MDSPAYIALATEDANWTRSTVFQKRGFSFSTTRRNEAQQDGKASEAPKPPSTPYSSLTIGIPLETCPGERRVALTPQNAERLLKKGFSRVLIEHGAGAEAQFPDAAYKNAGATLVERNTVWSESDILLKVRAPRIDGSNNEVRTMREGGTLLSFLYPLQNKNTVDALAVRGVTSFAMDMVPRISRAQVFDALRYARSLL